MLVKSIIKQWLPNNCWAFIRKFLIIKKHHKVVLALSPLVDNCLKGELEGLELIKKIDFPNGKKIIWQYWAQGYNKENIPELISICLSSIDKYASNYTIIRLSDTNISQYIDIPDWLMKKRHKCLSHILSMCFGACSCLNMEVYG